MSDDEMSDDEMSDDEMSDDEMSDDEMSDDMSEEEMAAAEGDLVIVAAGRDDLTTLVAAIEAAGLVDTLANDGPFTIFAPNDDAFVEYLGEMGMTAEDALADTDVPLDAAAGPCRRGGRRLGDGRRDGRQPVRQPRRHRAAGHRRR